MKPDPLGDRMKSYEGASGGDAYLTGGPVVVRLDGRAFSTFTRDLCRPFDESLHFCMGMATAVLVAETNARIGYTQSDEITLVLEPPEGRQQYFGGRRDKIISVLASLATIHFNHALALRLPDKVAAFPVFDARAFVVPSRTEAVNALIWRERDATRNAILAAAQSGLGHKATHGVDCGRLLGAIKAAGTKWDDYPAHFTRGIYVQHAITSRAFTADEIEALPPMHNARKEPNLVFERRTVTQLHIPPLETITNREAVVFDGATATT